MAFKIGSTTAIDNSRNSNFATRVDIGSTNLQYDSANSQMRCYSQNGNLAWIVANDGALVLWNITDGGSYNGIIAARGYRSIPGIDATAYGSGVWSINWSSPYAYLWINNVNTGAFWSYCDYRIKRNVVNMSDGAIQRIKQLRPITYQHKNFDFRPDEERLQSNNPEHLFKESEDIKEGFIAHELAEVIPSAVDGQKDEDKKIQTIKPDAIIAVLTKAVQELTEKVEILEQKVNSLV